MTRNAQGKIVSVMFTCENPEYWMTLWQVDPQKVLSLYQSLVNPAVRLDDLSLKDSQGQVVVDPTTGKPAYNPLNKWNSGTQTGATSGGAVHLTSSPNTLGAEFDLAAAATMPRAVNGDPVTSASKLVCCGRYGKIGRHSDPTIGQNVNNTVNYVPQLPQARATLTNPPGLYMQQPDFRKSNYVTPDGTPAETFWTVVRGKRADPKVSGDIDRILHATFEVAAEKGYTVSDITIGGAPILYGSQITVTITMALMATAFGNSGVTQTAVGCTVANDTPSPSVSAIQPYAVFAAYRQQELASNELALSIPILAFSLQPGQQTSSVALLLNTSDTPAGAVFTVPEGGVSIRVDGSQQLPQFGMNVYLVSLSVDAQAKPGDRTVLASVPGMPATTQAAIGLLSVAAPVQPVRMGAVKPSFRKGRA